MTKILSIRIDTDTSTLKEFDGDVRLGAGASAPTLTHVGGYIYLEEGVSSTSLTPIKVMHGVPGRVLAVSTYVLWLSDADMLYAGCKGPLTKDQALAYLQGRTDERQGFHSGYQSTVKRRGEVSHVAKNAPKSFVAVFSQWWHPDTPEDKHTEDEIPGVQKSVNISHPHVIVQPAPPVEQIR